MFVMLPLYAGVGLDAGEAVAVGDGYRGRATTPSHSLTLLSI